MIYPEDFPEDRNEDAERRTFNQLKLLPDRYDIFYSRHFVTDGAGKKPEFEIDFIIVDNGTEKTGRAILCLEVKGGVMHYDGVSGQWTQNGQNHGNPVNQITGASHSMANQYSSCLGEIPVDWALCFPECQVAADESLPVGMDQTRLIDAGSLLHIRQILPDIFSGIRQRHPSRQGGHPRQYDEFRKALLRSLGFVQLLSTQIRYNEKRFVELTEEQLGLLSLVSENDNLLIKGPAGSGKTILAKTLALDYMNSDKKVLFMCFNRALSNKIRYDFPRDAENIEVATFHSLARRLIEKNDPEWWENNRTRRKESDFWDMEIPEKLDSCMDEVTAIYDVLIIDEGQDFREWWFELVFRMVKPEGRKLVFLDETQNIFGSYSKVPAAETFTKLSLKYNCRNTRKIVSYLSEIIENEISAHRRSPEGSPAQVNDFVNRTEEATALQREIASLTGEHGIMPEQIILLLSGERADSCLANVQQINGMRVEALDRSARFNRRTIHYSGIKLFKGLESDIVFVLDDDQLGEERRKEFLYTMASRAKNKLYVWSVRT